MQICQTFLNTIFFFFLASQSSIVTKKTLIAEIAGEANLPKTTVETVINSFLIKTQQYALEQDKSVRIPKFGIFSKRATAARTMRNPANGTLVEVAAKEKLGFKPSKQGEDDPKA